MRRVGDSVNAASELRVALIGGQRLSESLRDACVVDTVPTDWSDSWLLAVRPHMLLIETEGIDRARRSAWTMDRISSLIGACRAFEVPTAVWVSDRADVDRFPTRVLDIADGVFGPDPAAVEALARRSQQRATVVPHAASARALGAEGQRGQRIAYVGGYHRDWSPRTREFVEAVLDAAAPLGLLVVARTKTEVEELPRRFRPHLYTTDGDGVVAALQECRVLVNFEPEDGVARSVFDALAVGVGVVAPRNHIAMRVLPQLVAYPRLAEDVMARIEWLLQDGREQQEQSAAGRRAVRNAHTYQHRLSAIAAALGYSALPDLSPPGASGLP